jgi:hypothetical protein
MGIEITDREPVRREKRWINLLAVVLVLSIVILALTRFAVAAVSMVVLSIMGGLALRISEKAGLID